MRKEVRERILIKCDNRCVQCGSISNLQVDHIIPICRGGRHDEDNFQILCKMCNLKKGNSIDFTEYFCIGESPEYILMRTDIPIALIINKDFTRWSKEMFRRNAEAFYNG